MKKNLTFLFISLSLMILLLGFINSDTCNPDSGYNKCFFSENIETYGSCKAVAYAEVQGNNNIQVENGEIDYSNGVYYVTGNSYIPYKLDSKYKLLYENKDWGTIWDSKSCSKSGCSFDNYEKRLVGEGRYYLTNSLGDSYSGCPTFIAYDHDLDEQSSCWAYATQGQGWGWADSSGDCKVVEQVECISGDTRCSGSNFVKCENYEWNDKGKVVGKCGVECLDSSDCGEEETTGEPFCSTEIAVSQEFKVYDCVSNNCQSNTEVREINVCEDACENGKCIELSWYEELNWWLVTPVIFILILLGAIGYNIFKN